MNMNAKIRRKPRLTNLRINGLVELATAAEASIQMVAEGGDGDLVVRGKVKPNVDAALDYIRELQDWVLSAPNNYRKR